MKPSMKTISHLLLIALLVIVPFNVYPMNRFKGAIDLSHISLPKEKVRRLVIPPEFSRPSFVDEILKEEIELLGIGCPKTPKKVRFNPSLNGWFGRFAKKTQYVVTRKITEPYTIPQSKFFDRHPHVQGAGIISGATSALMALGYFGGTYIKNNIDSSVLSGSRIGSLVSKIGFNAVELSKKIDGLDINPKYIAASLGLVGAGVSTLYWLRQPYKKEIVDEIVQARGGEIWHPDQVKMHRVRAQYTKGYDTNDYDLYSHLIDKLAQSKDSSIFSIANYEDDCWRNDTIKAVQELAENPEDTFELSDVESTVFNMLNQYLDDPIENASLKERLLGSYLKYLHDVMPAVELYRLLKKTFPEATITLIENKILLGDEEESFEERYQDKKNNLSKMTDLELKNSLRGFLLAYEGVRENPMKKQSFLIDPKSKDFFEVACNVKKLLNVEVKEDLDLKIAKSEFSIDYCCEHMNDSGTKEMISMLKDMPKKIRRSCAGDDDEGSSDMGSSFMTSLFPDAP